MTWPTKALRARPSGRACKARRSRPRCLWWRTPRRSLDGCGRGRVFTAQPALPVDAADVDAVERVAVANAVRPPSEGEPPLYSWVRLRKALKPCWRDSRAAAAVARLLALCDAAAQDGARALGVQLRRQPCVSAIVNVWLPGSRAQTRHDDGQDVMTVLLRLRAALGSGELQFQDSSRLDVWHAALGERDTLLVFGPHVPHAVTASAQQAQQARVTLVALYATAKPERAQSRGGAEADEA